MQYWQRPGSRSNSITSSSNDDGDSRRSAATAHRHNAPDLSADIENKHVQFHPDNQVFDEEKAYDLQKTDSRRPSETATLIDEALNRQEAKDRHAQFSGHIAESMTLIHNVLSGRRRSSDTVQGDDPAADEKTSSGRGISVLGNLLRLEAQMHHTKSSTPSPKYPCPPIAEDSRGLTSASLREERSSLYSHDSTAALHFTDTVTSIKKQPREWLKTVSSNNHLVPSLGTKKRIPKISSPIKPRIPELEQITVEDRVRIAFEIANLLQRQEFLRKLAKALMLYGCPAHRLEYILKHVADTLKVDAEFVYIPNVMLITFLDAETHTTETHFVTQSSGFDMHKLGEIYRLEKLISHHEVTVDEALEFMDKVASDPQFYPLWLNPFIYAILSLSGSIMFYGGRWKEAGLSAGLAMFFAVYELFSGRFWGFQPIWEITVCIIIGFVSRASTKFGFCFIPTAFASFIVILPGYSIAIAIIELVSRQLVSGVVHTGYAIIYSFLLGYGISMGSALYMTIDTGLSTDPPPDCQVAANANTCIVAVSQYYHFLTVPLFAIAYCQLLRARLPRWPTIIFVSFCGFTVNWLLSCLANAPQQVIQVVPAFTVGLIGNILTKLTGKMSFDAVLTAIFYLVPGSLGLKAALGAFGGSTTVYESQGASFALSMIESCIGIAVGLCIANLIVYPKGAQHTPLMNF